MSDRLRASEPRERSGDPRGAASAGETPFQTVGPFFGFALVYADGGKLAESGTVGARTTIEGLVLDGAGAPVPDAIVEIWQANAAGRYHHPDDTSAAPLDPAF